MRTRIFVYTYSNPGAFEISKQERLLGFSTTNTGTKGNIRRLKPGDLVLVRDSTQSKRLAFFGLFEIQAPMREVDETAKRIWREEQRDDKVIFYMRVPARLIRDELPTISIEEILQLGWKTRYAPWHEYSWQGYTRLFAGNFLTEDQAEQISALLDLEIFQSPRAADIDEPLDSPERVRTEVYRIIRDTARARSVKKAHHFECQICHAPPIELPTGRLYAESHHIRPLGASHRGPDVEKNILCVCPTCHVKLDYGVIELDYAELSACPKHEVDQEFVNHHNEHIYNMG